MLEGAGLDVLWPHAAAMLLLGLLVISASLLIYYLEEKQSL